MNIEQLVEKGKTKDKNAINKIIEIFTPLILKKVNSIYIKGYEREDLIQIGYISVINAIRHYDINKKINFAAYVSMAIEKNYYNEIRKRYKHNYEISYDKILQDGFDLSIGGVDENSTIEDRLILKEEYKKLKEALSILSVEEREFIYYIIWNGYGGIKQYSNLKNIKYETLQKRKKKILEKLKQTFK